MSELMKKQKKALVYNMNVGSVWRIKDESDNSNNLSILYNVQNTSTKRCLFSWNHASALLKHTNLQSPLLFAGWTIMTGHHQSLNWSQKYSDWRHQSSEDITL